MCLGVLLDSTLTFAPHVRRLAGRCFYHLCQLLRTVRRSLTDDAAKTTWYTHSSSTGLTTAIVCFMGCRLAVHIDAPTTECPQLCCASGAEDVEVQHYCSRPRSAPLAACVCETTRGVQAGVIRVQGPPSDSSTVPCRHVSTRVSEYHATPSSLGRSRGSCGAAMQNNKIRKVKFSRVCSINLEHHYRRPFATFLFQ